MSNSNKGRILIQMTGSIACFKACALISKLVQAGHHVKIVASASALKFVGAATLEGLTGEKVHSDLWESGEAMAHIHLMRWADVIVVVPASAHFINRVSQGIGDDLLTTMFLAHDFTKPYLVAPAMNTSMYLHPATQKSIATLKGMGLEILEAASGVLACGERGYGRLLEPDLLLKEIEGRLKPGLRAEPFETRSASDLALDSDSNSDSGAASASTSKARLSKKVLITAGGTQEPIDGVRVLSNLSTGGTGAEIADRLESLGFPVVLLHARSAQLPDSDGEKIRFTTSNELAEALRKRLAKGDIFAVIHLAAVSDFEVATWSQQGKTHAAAAQGKISSSADLDLHLTRTQKILPRIRSMAPGPLHLTAFKMTSAAPLNEAQAAVTRVLEQGHPDWVVHNDTTQIARERGSHQMTLYRGSLKDPRPLGSRAELVEEFAQAYSALLNDEKGRTR